MAMFNHAYLCLLCVWNNRVPTIFQKKCPDFSLTTLETDMWEHEKGPKCKNLISIHESWGPWIFNLRQMSYQGAYWNTLLSFIFCFTFHRINRWSNVAKLDLLCLWLFPDLERYAKIPWLFPDLEFWVLSLIFPDQWEPWINITNGD